MKHTLVYIAIATIGVSLVACSSNTTRENTAVGAVTGGVLGGLAGSAIGAGTGQAVAIGAGIVAGALIGGYVGSQMDSSDKAHVYEVLDHNPPHKYTRWKNSRTGAVYSVGPTSRMVTVNGNPNCRMFTTTVLMNGKKQTVDSVACRQSDGTWAAVR